MLSSQDPLHQGSFLGCFIDSLDFRDRNRFEYLDELLVLLYSLHPLHHLRSLGSFGSQDGEEAVLPTICHRHGKLVQPILRCTVVFRQF